MTTKNPLECSKYKSSLGTRIEKAFSTTESQRELWATMVFGDKSSLCYNESISLYLNGDVDTDILKQAYSLVIKQHDSLRSAFSQNGKYQLIFEEPIESFYFEDLSKSHKTEQLLNERQKTATLQAFDLINGPLIKAILLKKASNEYVLILTAHHIICDGWSMSVILSELSSFYSALKNRKEIPFKKTNQFTDYVQSRLDRAKGQDVSFWQNKLSKKNVYFDFPTDFARSADHHFESLRVDFKLDQSDVKQIRLWAAKRRISFSQLLLGIFQILIYKISNENEFAIGISAADQARTGKLDLVGHLVKMLPIFSQVDNSLSVDVFFSQLKDEFLTAMDHSSVTYGQMLKTLRIDREYGKTPFINLIFNVDQQYPGQGLNFDEIEAFYESNPRFYENFEMFINATTCGDHVILECQYKKQLFLSSTINNWLENYANIIKQIIRMPDLKIEDISLDGLAIPTTKSERQTQLASEKKSQDSFGEQKERLKAIWKDILLIDDIDIHDNFFHLGGHSLLAIEVINRLNEEEKLQLSLKHIFLYPTIDSFAFLLARPKSGDAIVKIKKQSLNTAALTLPQFRAWYTEQLRPKTTVHNLPSAIKINQKINVDNFQKAFNFIIRKHDSLRITIHSEGSKPYQKLNDFFDYKISVISCTTEKIVSALEEASQKHFDLAKAPLFEAKLYKLAHDQFVFYFMVHHIIWDGWCFDIFFKELDEIYSKLENNESLSHDDSKINYLDYADHQSQLDIKSFYSDQLDYWKKKLSEQSVLELPLDFHRPKERADQGDSVAFTLEAHLTQKLRDFSRLQKISLFTLFMTAYKIALALYSQQKDVSVGTPVQGRHHSDLKSIIGYFVNTLVVRTHIDLSLSFKEQIENVKAEVTEAFGHQDIPFEYILKELSFQRESNRTPLFQTFFSYQDVTNRSQKFNGITYEQINISKKSPHTDLDLWIKNSQKKIEGGFDFPVDLFKKASIERFKESFLVILETMINATNSSISNRVLLDKQHLNLLHDTYNQTQKSVRPDENVLTQFQKMVELYPQKVAVRTGCDKSITYAQLDKKSDILAKSLLTKGVRPGSYIGLSCQRSEKMIIALLAILKTNSAYIPLDPSFPQERLDYMVKKSGIHYILMDSQQKGRFTDKIIEVDLDREYEVDVTFSSFPKISHHDTAYVIFTSGTTGQPKGVEISHGAFHNFLTSMQSRPGMVASDRLLAVTTLSFDIAALELFLPLTIGASLYLATKDQVVDGSELCRLIETEKINYMQATPSTWQLLLLADWKPRQSFKVLCGGEALPIELAKKLSSFKQLELWNMYGPTETTIWSTCKKITNPHDITIGRPINNTHVYILDHNLISLPIGAIGELFIGGAGLAKGYFGRDDLTHKTFVYHPLTGERIYKTGDLAKFNFDGDIICLGRNDGQVKLRGYRIELGEIQARLSELEEVEEALVMISSEVEHDKRIVAYLKLKNDRMISEKEMREYLRLHLPLYMVPSHFIILKKFPKTLNGKIDKKELPRLTTSRVSINNISSTTNEQLKLKDNDGFKDRMRSLWEKHLQTEEIKDHDDFFLLGGHSLLAIELLKSVSDEFSVTVPLACLLENSKLDSFTKFVEADSRYLDRSLTNEKFSPLVPIRLNNRSKSILFCFHGAGGNVLNYASLRDLIGEDYSIYGIQSPGVNGEHFSYETLEDLASLYAEAIFPLIKNESNIIFSGGSMGGLLALEVAHQMSMKKINVKKLIMFDTFAPHLDLNKYSKNKLSWVNNLSKRFYYKYEHLKKSLLIKTCSWIGAKPPLELISYFLERKHYKLIRHYQGNSFDGDLELIRAKSAKQGLYSYKYLGWEKYIKGKIETYEISGKHDDFLESDDFKACFKRVLN